MARRTTHKQPGAGRRLEWIGGRVTAPFFITDREQPYHPDMVLWIERPSGVVVGHDVVAPEASPGAVGRALASALAHPLAGPPRRPDTIRVAADSLAGEVRDAIGAGIPILVAPTPELDELVQVMAETMPGRPEERSYFEDGAISSDAVEEMFDAAEALLGAAPWDLATDDRVLRADIPSLDVNGACVSIVGRLGISRGLLIFPSIEAYESFCRMAEDLRGIDEKTDFGTGWLSFTLEGAGQLPETMLREAIDLDWECDDEELYPRVERFDRHGTSISLVERDLKIASACALALAPFFVRNMASFEVDDDDVEPACESCWTQDGVEVRFTVPYDALELFDVDDAGPSEPTIAAPRVGRNDPCPCGSGRKYKKCHLPIDQQRRAEAEAKDPHHDLDGDLVERLLRFGRRHVPDAWDGIIEPFTDPGAAIALMHPWAAYHASFQGETLAERYVRERAGELSRAELDWIGAQRAAWLSVWEVIDVEPGRAVTLHDLLTDERRTVREASGSRTLVVRDALLGYIVDHDGVSLLCGTHPRPLTPRYAADVVQLARGRLRRKRAVPVDRLRDERFSRSLIRLWEESVEALDLEDARPRRLVTSDGDEVLLTTDHFRLAPGARRAVAKKIAGLDVVERGDAGDGEEYVFMGRDGGDSSQVGRPALGFGRLDDTELKLVTNSLKRADDVRRRIEAACGALIRHRAREHADPLSSKAPRGEPAPLPDVPPEELRRVTLEYKERHYAEWIDVALPALDGETPRQAARTAGGRSRLDLLLKEMENMERRHEGDAAFDFSTLRRRLKLD